MTITVILCTYNRCRALAKALESLAALRLPESDSWEVMVVDNNSRDQTREVVDSFCRRYPGRFRYLFERRQGKSYALNAGIREAQSDVLAFTDDDVIVDSGWLQNLSLPFHKCECAGVGGRTLPQRTFSAPGWLSLETRHALGPLGLFDLGPAAEELIEPPYGNNMAFRREKVLTYGGFRTDLGPRPGSEIRGEDSDFGHRLLSAGERLRYEPSAIVCHAVPKSRLQKKYFLAWWFDKGRTDIRGSGFPLGVSWQLAGIPLVLFTRLAACVLRWIVAIGPSRRFSCKVSVWAQAGRILECYSENRGQAGSARGFSTTKPAAESSEGRT